MSILSEVRNEVILNLEAQDAERGLGSTLGGSIGGDSDTVSLDSSGVGGDACSVSSDGAVEGTDASHVSGNLGR